ncbi:MAG: hypothetical protein OMM_05539 [Candidatus Magnetoglobus multicellularis str. Araruama]|uniref:Uncharacterized protein n=1 Tax=Candidatus Magnetoglobus multicellularis str. Araruama TaxID=890399 RepID=A0A1V1NVU3_9BACT|nr:MAG: hypothetical protein OMM_05539 [Candidatus Magnetoglobus multicellularis str. Araruama]
MHEGFKGKARIVIFYTDQSFKDAARPVSAFSDIIETEFSEYITEIVLNEYTLSQLLEVDPKLVILAPFTVPPSTPKEKLTELGREWKAHIQESYSTDEHNDAINVIGLFVMNRFRDLSREEIISMFHFDILNTVAGQQIYKEAWNEAWNEAWKKAREQTWKEAREQTWKEAGDYIRKTLQESMGDSPENIEKKLLSFLRKSSSPFQNRYFFARRRTSLGLYNEKHDSVGKSWI